MQQKCLLRIREAGRLLPRIPKRRHGICAEAANWLLTWRSATSWRSAAAWRWWKHARNFCEAYCPGTTSIHRFDMNGLGELYRGGKVVLDEFGEGLDAHPLGLNAEICQSLLQRRVL